MSNRIVRLTVSLILVLAVAGISSAPQTARAAGPWYVVPGGNDSNDCQSPGSACATINGAIGKASPGDTIYVAIGMYTSSTGSEVVLIDRNVTLSGGWDASFIAQSGMSTIDGELARGGVMVNNIVTAIIERFVIQNSSGYPGGGIVNNGSLTLTGSTVRGNVGYISGGGGIYNDNTYGGGTLTLNNSTVSGNMGGGINNYLGILTLTSSNISNNIGRGIESVQGIMSITSSTVNGNSNGGIANFYGGSLTLTNSTVSGNTLAYDAGGGIASDGILILNNSTVSGNISHDSGGIANYGGTVALQNSIVAGNTAYYLGPDCTGIIDSAGHNLIGNTLDCNFTPGAGDLTDVSANLGQLIGSPGYHPLLLGSPAIDAGNPAGCSDNLGNPLNTDQRGLARPQGSACDIGAYEYVESTGAPASLGYLDGSNQRIATGMVFPKPFTVYVLDNNGSPASGVTLTFTAPASGPSGIFTDSGTNVTTALSDSGGIASSSFFTANDQPGSYIATAAVAGLADTITFALTNFIAPPNDNFSSAKTINQLPFNDSMDNTEATLENGETLNCYLSMKTVWYSYTPANNALIRADMLGSSFEDTSLAIYQATGPGIGDLIALQCADYGATATFSVQAGVTYYFQAGSIYSGGGNLNLNLREVLPPANDDFANALVIPLPLPYDTTVDTDLASVQAEEPLPTCANSNQKNRSVWYAFTPTTSGSVSASVPAAAFNPLFAAYTGNSLGGLTEVGCRAFIGNVLTIQVNPGITYYFQISDMYPWEQGGSLQFHLEVTPPPVASFNLSPSDPTVFDTIQFSDQSSDPGQLGFQSFTWDFGDGTTATGSNPIHKYAADGDYTVQHSVVTVDGRSASISQVVPVRTHDVAIPRLTAPKSANAGQTRTITVSVRNSAYPEMVQVDLYRGTTGGFEWIATSTLPTPGYSGNRTTSFSFSYTFTSQDAQIGKVTFRAVATILNGRDAWPTDNEAFSSPPTKVTR